MLQLFRDPLCKLIIKKIKRNAADIYSEVIHANYLFSGIILSKSWPISSEMRVLKAELILP